MFSFYTFNIGSWLFLFIKMKNSRLCMGGCFHFPKHYTSMKKRGIVFEKEYNILSFTKKRAKPKSCYTL